ncbi:MAG TPA: PLP-dependent aminotransferase family protein [Rhizomicrobium sp.]|jgi:GntR family transcriptional regulator/MocR family aminotransferase
MQIAKWLWSNRIAASLIVALVPIPNGDDVMEVNERIETEASAERAVANFPLAIANITINADSPVPIYEQICTAVRVAIGAGDLPPGTPLPTSRELAHALGVGRNTIVSAYSRLSAEGYLVSNTRRGTRVTDEPVGAPAFRQERGTLEAQPVQPIEIGYHARRILELPFAPTQAVKSFALNAPDPSLYPRNPLSRLLAEEFCRPTGGDMRHGYKRFQTALAAYLRHMRGVNCEPGQIIPLTGLESALDLTARVLLDPGHSVLIEDPAPDAVRHAFAAAGAIVETMPSDSAGADPSRAAGPPPRIIFVSPSIGFPFGRQMPEQRRRAVLELASRARSAVFEADIGGELAYSGSRLRAIQGQDGEGRVIYFGGLSETLGSHIRAAYLVVPPHLVGAFTDMAERIAYGPDAFILSALATFIEENHYAMHIRNVRSVYAQRLKAMVEAARLHIPEATILEPAGGLHLPLLFPHGLDEAAAVRCANEQGLAVAPLSRFYRNGGHTPGLVLGFGTVPERVIDTAMRKLASAIAQSRSRPADLVA